jgi:hypothetical protein
MDQGKAVRAGTIVLVSISFGLWYSGRQAQERAEAAANAARQEERAREERRAADETAAEQRSLERADREALRWIGRSYVPAYERARSTCSELQACFNEPTQRIARCAARTEQPCEAALARIPVTSAPERVRLAAASDVDDLRFLSICVLRAALRLAPDDERSWDTIRRSVDDATFEQTRVLQNQLCADDFLVPPDAVQSLPTWLNERFTYPGGGCWDGDRDRWRVLSISPDSASWRRCSSAVSPTP